MDGYLAVDTIYLRLPSMTLDVLESYIESHTAFMNMVHHWELTLSLQTLLNANPIQLDEVASYWLHRPCIGCKTSNKPYPNTRSTVHQDIGALLELFKQVTKVIKNYALHQGFDWDVSVINDELYLNYKVKRMIS